MKTILTLLLWFVFAMALAVFLPGCATRAAKSPAGESRAGAVSVSQTGDAHTPAKASSDTQTASVPLPSGSSVTFNEKLGTVSATLAADSIFTVETRRDLVTGPQAFTPPAPPSPSDLANGRAVWFYRVALFAGIAAAVFGLVRGWNFVMYGGGAVSAASCAGLFMQSHPLLAGVIGGGVALAVSGVWIWHTRLKHTPFAPDPLPSA